MTKNHEVADIRKPKRTPAGPKNDAVSYGTKGKTRAGARVGHKKDEAPSEPFRSPHLIGSPGEVTGDERTFLADGFGGHLKQLRLTRKLTQQETAGMSGISQMYLSRLERGHRRPTIDALEALASVLAPDDTETVRDHLAELAGESLRESAQRRRQRRESRRSLRWIERLKRENDRNQGRVERLRAAGVTGMADQLEDIINTIHRQVQEREPQEREVLAALGDDPNEEFTPMPVYQPRRKRRSYGPR